MLALFQRPDDGRDFSDASEMSGRRYPVSFVDVVWEEAEEGGEDRLDNNHSEHLRISLDS